MYAPEIPVLALATSEATVPVFTLAIVTVMPLSTTWNTLGKFRAVPVPMLETCAENGSPCPVVPEVGTTVVPSVTVRSGRSAHEFEFLLHVPLVQR